MCIALGKELSGLQGTPLFYNTVYEEVRVASEQDDVPATHVFDRSLPNQGDAARPHPRKHARAMNAHGNVAALRQRFRNARRVISPAFTAEPVRLLPLILPILHPFLKTKTLKAVLPVASARLHAYLESKMRLVGAFPNSSNKGSGSDIKLLPPLNTSVEFQVGTVNGPQVPVCPKVQHFTVPVSLRHGPLGLSRRTFL
jgi:hypothetical protein